MNILVHHNSGSHIGIPQTSKSSIQKLSERQIIGPHSDLLTWNFWGKESSNLCFNKPSRLFWCMLEFENHCARVSLKIPRKLVPAINSREKKQEMRNRSEREAFQFLMFRFFFLHAYVSPILNKNLTKLWSKMDKKWAQCFWKTELWVLVYSTILKRKERQPILDQDFNAEDKAYL